MARLLERRIPLGEDDFLDVRLFIERGVLTGFVLNYTAVISGEPTVVCRYDTCHGRLHVHRMWLEDAQPRDLEDTKGQPNPDYATRLKAAETDLLENWAPYRARMELKHNEPQRN